MVERNEKVGIGIVTCNRPDYLIKLLDSIKYCNWAEFIIVNDGDKLDIPGYNYYIHTNETNLGVGKSKNIAMQHLLDKGCEYIFIIEDDMIILDDSVFDRYIRASKASGIQHFNYGPGSPFNRKQNIKFDLHNRHLLDQHSEPNPRLVVDYGDDIKVSLFEHTVAMFSFFTREVLEKVGLYDDAYYNAWEHVDHSYMIIKAGYHPPFWWFADLYDSHKYITEAPEAINNSSIANNSEQWHKNVYGGREIYKQKHGHYPNEPPFISKDQVVQIIKQLKK
jgi:GT2 family glycosyltransferase